MRVAGASGPSQHSPFAGLSWRGCPTRRSDRIVTNHVTAGTVQKRAVVLKGPLNPRFWEGVGPRGRVWWVGWCGGWRCFGAVLLQWRVGVRASGHFNVWLVCPLSLWSPVHISGIINRPHRHRAPAGPATHASGETSKKILQRETAFGPFLGHEPLDPRPPLPRILEQAST